MENYAVVQERSDYLRFAMNSVILSLGSTFVALLFAIPAAWAMAFAPAKRTKDLLMWMLSTKMMPPVGALIPIYLIFRDIGLLDTRGGLDRRAVPAQPADRRVDALHLFQGNPRRDPGSGAHGRRLAVEGAGLCADPHGDARHRLDLAAQHHPGLERGVLDAQPDDIGCGAADRSSSPPIRARKACSGPSSRPLRPWPSRRSWCSAGSRRNNLSAASHSER